ncbi:hypothetical protein SUDANB178_00120 [Streptomyces sp. enrichment culture]
MVLTSGEKAGRPGTRPSLIGQGTTSGSPIPGFESPDRTGVPGRGPDREKSAGPQAPQGTPLRGFSRCPADTSSFTPGHGHPPLTAPRSAAPPSSRCPADRGMCPGGVGVPGRARGARRTCIRRGRVGLSDTLSPSQLGVAGSAEACVSASLGAVPAVSGTRRLRGRTRSAAYSFSPLRPGARPTAVKPHRGSCARPVAVTADTRMADAGMAEVLREPARAPHGPGPRPTWYGASHRRSDRRRTGRRRAAAPDRVARVPAHRPRPPRLPRREPRVIDARGTHTADAWRGAGWTYRVLGRP